MIFVMTLVAMLVCLVLDLAGVITVSGWTLAAIWPGIWLAWVTFWLCVALLLGILALIFEKRGY